MKNTLLVLLASLVCASANAQTIKVLKSKGKKAVVQTSEELTVGETYSLGGGEGGSGEGGEGSRSFAIGGEFGFSSASVKSGSTTTSGSRVTLTPEVLWNLGQFEVGGGIALSNTKSGNSESSSTVFRAIGEYNFVMNNPGVEWVYGAGAELGFGSGKSGSSSYNLFAFSGYGILKYFPSGVDTSFFGKVGMDMTTLSASGSKQETTEFGISGGVRAYFF